MTTDKDDALLLVREHLRQIEPPPGAKARVSFELEERIAGRARSTRPLWVLGLTGALVAGVSIAATNGAHWFASEPQAAPTTKIATPVAPPSPPKQQRVPQQTSNVTPASAKEQRERDVEPKRASAGVKQTSAPNHGATPDSTLAKQVAELQAAMAYAERDDQRALAELRAFKRRWPKSPLNHEADIEIVAALQRLGRDQESRAAAKRFVRAHPDSAKAREMNALAEDAKAP